MTTNELWELVQEISNISEYNLRLMFDFERDLDEDPDSVIRAIFTNYDYDTIKTRYEDFKTKYDFIIGDEVTYNNKNYVVTRTNDDGGANCFIVSRETGLGFEIEVYKVIKTGNHFDVDWVGEE